MKFSRKLQLISWRHVGLYKRNKKLIAVLFDVALTDKVDKVDIAILKMKKKLNL